MDFCPGCGTRLFPKIATLGEQVNLLLGCKKCGYKDERKTSSSRFTVKTMQHSPKQMVAVIDKKENFSIEPTIQAECLNCGNNKAYVWQVQTRGADESSTQFMRCTKCGYTSREYT